MASEFSVSNLYFKQSPGFLLHKTANAVKAALRNEFIKAGYDLTPEQWTCLCALWEEDGLSQGDLASKTGKDKTTITRILDLLQKKKLIERRHRLSDKRVFEIFLTPQGKELEVELTPLFIELQKRLTENFSPKEEEQLSKTLKKLYKNIE